MGRYAIGQIKGVIPAMLSPFDANEDASPDKAAGLARHLMQYGIGGLYLTGSTGEGFMMTAGERMALVEAVVGEVKGAVPVIVHVGAISTRQSAELARHARDAGADAISSVPPIYWNFSNDGIAGYYADLVQASGLPMIVYNIALAGLVSFDMILRLGRLDGVQGIKYTSNTHFDLMRIKEQLGRDFMVYSGSDEMAASGMIFGSDGLIGSTYNVIADLFVKLYAAAQAGDAAAVSRHQQAANRIIFTMLRFDLIPVLKRMLSFMGVDAGIARRPFTQYDSADDAAIRAAFAPLKEALAPHDIDFLRYI